MMLYAMDRARSVAENAGIVGFFVDAKDTQGCRAGKRSASRRSGFEHIQLGEQESL